MDGAVRQPVVDFDVFASHTLAENDAAWDRLRGCPVAWTPHNGGHWARRCIDSVIESGRCELVTQLVFPVPAAVTLEWLGFPESDWPLMTDAFHNSAAYPYGTPEYAAAAAALTDVLRRVHDEVGERLARPRDDGLSTIAHAVVDGEPISRERAEALVFMTIGGGVDTTSALSSAALLHLHRHPEDRARLLAEPDLMDSATEEFLRVYPPARTHARTVTRDVEFAGCHLCAGDRVLLSEVAAGRDPAAFPDADRFVIDRFPNRHLSFGAGIHRCPGSHLARITFHELLSEVLERIPDYRIVDDEVVEYPNWSMIGGWAQLPAVFTPGPRHSDGSHAADETHDAVPTSGQATATADESTGG